jgi:hypothetical protein
MQLGYIQFNARSPKDCQIERTNGFDSSQNGRSLRYCRSTHCFALGARKDYSQRTGHAFPYLSRHSIRLGTQARLETTQPHHQARKLQVAAFQNRQSFIQVGGDHVQDGLVQSRNRRGMDRNRSKRSQSNLQKEATDATTC